ncbi:MAG: T9SS C-terminal target domain-containing protein [Methanobacteriota archaeon]|nr:MAG: T9SS C-terminal target domain-containing protein [Euryarchaeota archaeon]
MWNLLLTNINTRKLRSCLKQDINPPYDLLGRKMMTLVDRKQTAGEYSVKVNAGNLSSGIYLYRLEAGSFVQTRKMILIK